MDSIFDKIIDKLYYNSIDHFVNYKKHLKDYAIVIVVALILRSMLIVIYTIPTGSMIPNLLVGDVLLADRFYYGLKLPFTDEKPNYRLPSINDPEVGDIIVFRAPREETFYRLTLFITDYDKAKKLLHDLNLASSFKRPISWSGNKKNYIFENNNENILLLHKSIYKQYKKQIKDKKNGFSIINETKRKLYMTYYETPNNNFFISFINTPLAGISILTTVFLDTPIGFPYKILSIFLYSLYNGETFSDAFYNFKLYPNDFIDTTKDFVKRLVAKEGDKVEIKNGHLFINDVDTQKKMINKNLNSKYFYYDNALIKKDGTKINFTIQHLNQYTHPIDENEPHIPFRADLWPYDPNQAAQSGLFVQSFGPIIVKKDHYFFVGDNRDESFDSRFLGTVPKFAIKGRPFFRLLPINRVGKIQ